MRKMRYASAETLSDTHGIHVYSNDRKCSRCGTRLSVYNGNSICNPCWTTRELPNMETELGEQIERAFMGGV